MSFLIEASYIFSASRITLSMDLHDASFVYGDLVGSIIGDVRFKFGIKGQALNLWDKASYINYGVHNHECFYNPGKCTSGVTFAMWLKTSTTQASTLTTIMDTGGGYPQNLGYVIWLENQMGKIVLEIKDGKTKYITEIMFNQNLGLWSHVIITWYKNFLAFGFINGCYATTKFHSRYPIGLPEPSTAVPFTLGARGTPHSPTCSMVLDEFHAWHVSFSFGQITQLFQQGGLVWNKALMNRDCVLSIVVVMS